MAEGIFLCAVILFICIFASKLSNRMGLPVLLLFLLLGILFGSDGVFGITFDNFNLAEQVCSFGLIFIMFYGGFGTNWKTARPVAPQSFLLASLGVVLTAGLTGLFCHLALGMDLLEGLLVGSVIGSTDAASVFSILRSRRLNLKGGMASLLELESGSNDPTAYTLTLIILGLMAGDTNQSIPYLIFAQVVYGLGFGFLVGYLAILALKKVHFSGGLNTILFVAVALFAYSLPVMLGGNGYLSVYIAGILLGNAKIPAKAELVHFFDGVTWIMQIVIFFSLGLLSFPSQMHKVLLPAVLIALFLTFVARPAAVFSILSFFKTPVKQQLLVSFAGLRGAASIVFAILAVVSDAYPKNDIFHIVFCVALLSVGFQGTLLPFVAKKLGLVSDTDSVLKTFNDYQDETTMNLVDITVPDRHPWVGLTLSDIHLPANSIVVLIKRGDGTVLPRGDTVVLAGDHLILSCVAYHDDSGLTLTELSISKKHRYAYCRIADIDLPPDTLVVMIKRAGGSILPKGWTKLLPDDTLVLCSANKKAPLK